MGTLNVGSKLRNLRGNKTQSEVAEAIGISESAYSMYERGERTPRDWIKTRIAEYYNVSVEFIFFDGLDTKCVRNKI